MCTQTVVRVVSGDHQYRVQTVGSQGSTTKRSSARTLSFVIQCFLGGLGVLCVWELCSCVITLCAKYCVLILYTVYSFSFSYIH